MQLVSDTCRFFARPPSAALTFEERGVRRGFALVVALALMSFMVLLLLGLTSLVSVETRRESGDIALEAARQNALLGLKVAIGQLQSLAGPDQRITARANILSDAHPSKAYWTGVWSSEEDSAVLDWLVSWPERGQGKAEIPSVLGGLSEGSSHVAVQIVGQGSADEFVEVAAVPIYSAPHGDRVVGHYAYWVGDEGVKAQVTSTNPYREEATDSLLFRAGLKTAQRSGSEWMSGLTFLASAAPSERDHLLDRVTSAGQFEVVAGLLGDSSGGAGMRTHYFDYTTQSVGLLTDVRRGGMRIDLTRALEQGQTSIGYSGSRIYDRGPSWSLLLDYYQNMRVDPSAPEIRLQRRNAHTGHDGWNPTLYFNRWPTAHGVAPVLVASELSMGLVYNYEDPVVEGLACLTVAPIIVLANPYNVRLAEESYIIQYNSFNSNLATANMISPQMYIRIGGVDLVQSYEENPGVTSTAIHINRLLPPNEKGEMGYNRNSLRFEIVTDFNPGEIKIFTLATTREYQTVDPPVLGEGYEVDTYAWVRPTARQEPQLIVPERALGEPPASLLIRGRSLYNSVTLSSKESVSGGTQLVTINPYFSPFGSAPTRPLSMETAKQIRFYTWLKGSATNEAYERNGAVKGLAHFNVRAMRHRSLFSDRGHFAAPYLYAGRIDYEQSQFDELRIWEPGALVALGDDLPRYALPLFHVLRKGERWQSLAELQHVDFSLHSVAPAYAVGNSLAHPLIDPDKVVQNMTSAEQTAEWVDLSWHLNDALWDHYYFSTLDLSQDEVSQSSIANRRVILASESLSGAMMADLQDAYRAALQLRIKGAFNVNSTSVEAWKAVLSGLNGEDVPYVNLLTNGRGISTQWAGKHGVIPVLRTGFPMGAESTSAADPHFWNGFATVSAIGGASGDSALERLAVEIVSEVKRRGPFRSLASFVNRTPGEDLELALRGPLQAAIDRSGVNPEGGPGQRFESAVSGLPNWNFPEAVAADTSLGMSGFRGVGAPGYLTQADVLTAIGSFLNVRSDTFTIRSYGDVVNTVARPGQVGARAWCEVVVQRTTGYVNSSDPEWFPPTHPLLSPESRQWGRRFQIISFRWLTEDEV